MEDYADSLAGVRVKKASVPGSSQSKSRFGAQHLSAKVNDNPYSNVFDSNAPSAEKAKEDINMAARKRFNHSSFSHQNDIGNHNIQTWINKTNSGFYSHQNSRENKVSITGENFYRKSMARKMSTKQILSLEDKVYNHLTQRITGAGNTQNGEDLKVLKNLCNYTVKKEVSQKVDQVSHFDIKRIEDQIYKDYIKMKSNMPVDFTSSNKTNASSTTNLDINRANSVYRSTISQR